MLSATHFLKNTTFTLNEQMYSLNDDSWLLQTSHKFICFVPTNLQVNKKRKKREISLKERAGLQDAQDYLEGPIRNHCFKCNERIFFYKLMIICI